MLERTTKWRRPVSNEKKIVSYCHCAKCMDERPDGVSPAEWAQLEVGWTKVGLQVWCRRHDCNVIHIDFEGAQHVANTRAKNKEGKPS